VAVFIDPDRNWLLDYTAPQRKNAELVAISPNPFNPLTTVTFVVRQPGQVRVEIFDIRGRLVRTLVDDHYGIGGHPVDWIGTDNVGRAVGSGIYLVRLTAADVEDVKKITLLR